MGADVMGADVMGADVMGADVLGADVMGAALAPDVFTTSSRGDPYLAHGGWELSGRFAVIYCLKALIFNHE